MAEDTGESKEVRLAFRLGYLGSFFAGSQFQPDQRTVEGEIIAACQRAGLFSDRKSARFSLSGRTDRGVHARSQILAFSTINPERAIKALNGQLPPDIWVTAWSSVNPEFYPRYDVLQRTYRYYYTAMPQDIHKMRSTAHKFLGYHDFSCFARIETGKNPVISIDEIRIEECECWCWLTVSAWGFLWHMVRCIATSLLMISEGSLSEEEMYRLLEGTCKNKIRPAPPDGLILWDVKTDLDWNEIPLSEQKQTYIYNSAREHLLISKIYSIIMNQENNPNL